MSLAVSLAAVFFLQGGHASATTINVTANAVDLTTNGNCSLYEALESADTDAAVDNCVAGSGADTVNVPNGTYVLAVIALDFGGTDLTVSGASRAGTIIDGDGGYGLNYDGGSGVHSLTLQHLTVTNTKGLSSLVSAEVNVIIDDTIWSNSFTELYHAPIRIYGDGATDLTVSNTEIYGNTSDDGLCGIETQSKDRVSLANVKVYDNVCTIGRILGLRGEVVTLDQVEAYGNESTGIIYVAAAASTVVEGLKAHGNTATDEGVVGVNTPDMDLSYVDVYDNTGFALGLSVSGALGSITLHHSSVVGNDGFGALFMTNDGGGFDVNVSNVTVANNTTGYSAITFMTDETNPLSGTIKNVTIVDNHRTGNFGFALPAGLLFMSNSQIAPTANLENILMSGNLDEATPQNCGPLSQPQMFSPDSLGHNLSNDNTCGDVFDQTSDHNNVDAMLDPLIEDNGTWVVPLQTNSPANDGGATVAGMTDDQRGTARPQNDAFDIGAYEVLGAATSNPGGGSGNNAGAGVIPGVPNTGFGLLTNNPFAVLVLTSVSTGAILLISRRVSRKT